MSTLLVAALSASASPATAGDDVATSELVAAINRRDVDAVAKHVELPVTAHNLKFIAAACARFAGKRIEIAERQDLEALIGCLADLRVAELDGKQASFFKATYGPGAGLHFAKRQGKVRAFFSFAPKAGTDVFLIEPTTFTSHVQKFRREIKPSAKLKKLIDASTTERAIAMLAVCVDARGKLTSVTATVRDEAMKAYEQDVTKAARKWSIKPFVVAGKGVAACGELAVGYPDDRVAVLLDLAAAPPPPPPPPPPGSDIRTGGDVQANGPYPRPQVVAPTTLEGYRIAGDKYIAPDDTTKIEIARAGKDRVIASIKLCIDDKGAPTMTQLLKSSGFGDYDTKLTREMGKWRYKPYEVNGKPVPVCTAVTFIYSQTPSAPAGSAAPPP